ncbi:hypothetical protein [Burkholderia ubonensis]|uniref:hypothetical protein n=1 Tax=Burkholderia ubonensis TaxID=101571 RepID=UPI000A4BF724|nr:hypothetical protein [Burkholderia ubonensis]
MQKNKTPLWGDLVPETAERQLRRIRDLIEAADSAIDAHTDRIKTGEASSLLKASMAQLVEARNEHERQMLHLLEHRKMECAGFALEGQKYDQHTVAYIDLWRIVQSIGDLFMRVCQAAIGPAKKDIPDSVRARATLRIAGFYESSFGIAVEIPSQVDLAGQSLSALGFENLFALVCAHDPGDIAIDYGPWVIKKYRELVERLLAASATPKFEWRSPFGDIRSWRPDTNELLHIKNRLAALRDEEAKVLEVNGVLAEASLIRMTFGIVGGGRTVKGKVPHHLSANVAALFNQRCRAVYEERRLIDEATEQEKKVSTLISIEPI